MSIYQVFEDFNADYWNLIRAAALTDTSQNAPLSHSQFTLHQYIQNFDSVREAITVARIADNFEADSNPGVVDVEVRDRDGDSWVFHLGFEGFEAPGNPFIVRTYFRMHDDFIAYPQRIREAIAPVQNYFNEELSAALAIERDGGDSEQYKRENLLFFYQHAGLEPVPGSELVLIPTANDLPPPLAEMTPVEAVRAIQDYYVKQLASAADRMHALLDKHIINPESPEYELFPAFEEIGAHYNRDGTPKRNGPDAGSPGVC